MTIAKPILTFSRSSVTSTANDIIMDINAYMAAYINNSNLKRQVFSGRRKSLNSSPKIYLGWCLAVVGTTTGGNLKRSAPAELVEVLGMVTCPPSQNRHTQAEQ
jgi:hypothetical protein